MSNNLRNTLDTVSRTSSTLSSTVSAISGGVFKLKLFFIVAIVTFALGLGIGLTAGVYYGYRKWTNKVDKLLEQGREYRHDVMDKVKEKLKEKI